MTTSRAGRSTGVKTHIRHALTGALLVVAGVYVLAQSPLAQVGVKEQQAREWLLRTLGQGCPCGAYAGGDPEIDIVLNAFKKMPASARGPMTTQLYGWAKALVTSPAFRADYAKERDHYRPRPTEYAESAEQELKKKVQEESEGREQTMKFMEANGMKAQAAQMRKEWPEQLKELTAAWRNEITEKRKKDADDLIQGTKDWESRIPADLNTAIARHLREFVATTADGETLHRDEWILMITASAANGIRLRPWPATITLGDGRAVVHREVAVEMATGPGPEYRRISYVTVYELRDDHWLVILNSSRQV